MNRSLCVGPASCLVAHEDGPDDDCQNCPSFRGQRVWDR